MIDQWEDRRLGDIASMGSGGTPSRSVKRFFGGGIPWVSISDMTSSRKYLTSTAATLTEEGLSSSAARLYEPGVILYAMYASLGEVCLAVGRVSSSQAILGINPCGELDREFLYYQLEAMKPLVKKLGQQGTQSNLNAGMVRDFRVLVPPVDEQRAIASTLAEADNLIVAHESSIAKKRAIKLGMHQQLLTRKTRLAGFTGEWATVAIASLLEFKNGLNKSSDFFGAGTPIVNFMDVMNGPMIWRKDVTGRVTLTKDEIKRFSARRGDLFFTRTSETVDEVGTAAVLVDDIPDACFSGFILRGRPRSGAVDSRFLARAFQLDVVRLQVVSSATYTTRALTNGRALGRVVVSLPAIDEQRAIVAVLDDMDAEIAALRAGLNKARAIKAGMMQQLLTGRVRLPAEAAS